MILPGHFPKGNRVWNVSRKCCDCHRSQSWIFTSMLGRCLLRSCWGNQIWKNISFQEIHDYLISGIPGGHNLNPFGEVVGGSEDAIVFSTRGWIYFDYEV